MVQNSVVQSIRVCWRETLICTGQLSVWYRTCQQWKPAWNIRWLICFLGLLLYSSGCYVAKLELKADLKLSLAKLNQCWLRINCWSILTLILKFLQRKVQIVSPVWWVAISDYNGMLYRDFTRGFVEKGFVKDIETPDFRGGEICFKANW